MIKEHYSDGRDLRGLWVDLRGSGIVDGGKNYNSILTKL
jgi:hypothetical protein